jgi:hypothetical protein
MSTTGGVRYRRRPLLLREVNWENVKCFTLDLCWQAYNFFNVVLTGEISMKTFIAALVLMFMLAAYTSMMSLTVQAERAPAVHKSAHVAVVVD